MEKAIISGGAVETPYFSLSFVLFICLRCFGLKSGVLEILAAEVCLLSCLMDVDGTRGGQSAKKYIWENLNTERHDSAVPDMDDVQALLSFRLVAPKRTCICGPRRADRARYQRSFAACST